MALLSLALLSQGLLGSLQDGSLRRPVRPSSTFSKHFSETTGTVSIKFHMQPPGKGARKEERLYIWSRSHDQDGRHAQYGKNLKASTPEPLEQLN